MKRKRILTLFIVLVVLSLLVGGLSCKKTTDTTTTGEQEEEEEEEEEEEDTGPVAPTGDYGDAPDGGSTGYPSPFAQVGNFPTLSASNGAHTLSVSEATLGPTASIEVDANDPADPDGVPNLTNTDSDDGITNFFITLISIPPPAALTVQIHSETSGDFYLNVLIDLNMDGEWGGVAGGGEAEWVVQNYPVSVTPGDTTVTPPAFAFANGNRLPDGAWARIALTREMITDTDWDGSGGSFSSGEVEDHIIRLPLVGGKRIPMLVVDNDGDYPVPGAVPVLCTVTVTNLRNVAGSFNWTLTRLNGDVDCAPITGGPVAIAEAGDPAGGDAVDVFINATNGTKDSQWLFTATVVDPDAVVTADGVTAGTSGESTTTLTYTTRKVSISSMDGSHVCQTDHCEVQVVVHVADDDGNPVSGATVTLQMTRPDQSKVTMEVTTDENGVARATFTVYVHETHTVEVLDITGEGMEYMPTHNLDPSEILVG